MVVGRHQANREAVCAWLDACNRKPRAELLHRKEDHLVKAVDRADPGIRKA